ncbi:hypothetical protein ACOMHN_027142 [Nucella lapillus]
MSCNAQCTNLSLLLLLLLLLCVLTAADRTDGTKRSVKRPPHCLEGYTYFAPFMKCDASLDYCFHYARKSCVGPPNWGCVHALNKVTVTGKGKGAAIKKIGLGNSRCCGGRFQSPIDIPVDRATCIPQMPTPVYLQNRKQLRGVFDNHGDFLGFKVDTSSYDDPLLLTNVPFKCVMPGSALYVLTSVQVRVGKAGRRSSEHSLQGRSFEAELHLVNVRRDFWTPSTSKLGGRHPSRVNLRCASQTPLGITTIAVFLSVTTSPCLYVGDYITITMSFCL